MQIKSVEIRDILSISNITFNFLSTGLRLVDGWNFDDDTANGAGKSSIFNALAFGIYNKIPRKITMSQIVRRGTKSGSVKVTIHSNGDEWVVERKRPVSVTFYKNGELQSITQEEFEKSIKMSYSQFLIAMYASQTEGMKLISLNDSGTKDFFLQLMNLEKIKMAKDDLAIKVKELKSLDEKLKAAIDSNLAKISAYEDYQVDRDSILKEIDANATEDLDSELAELLKVQEPDLSKYTDILKQIEKKRHLEVELPSREIRRINQECDSIKAQMEIDHINCPDCSAEIVVLGKESMSAREHKESLTAKLEELSIELSKLGDPDAVEQQLDQLQIDLKARRESEVEEYSLIKSKIQELNSTIAVRKSRVEELRSQLEKQESIASNIEKCRDTIRKTETILKKVNAELNEWETVQAVLSPTGAPAYIMDSVVSVFNDKVSSYVDMVWPNASYSLQTFKETGSGELRAKFSDNLTIGGSSVSVGSLSGGEYRCLSLAMDFAVIDTLETMFGISVNPVILDEPFNDLDSANRERVIELLEKVAINRHIVVIDHASEAKSMFSDVVRVEKRNGVSVLV